MDQQGTLLAAEANIPKNHQQHQRQEYWLSSRAKRPHNILPLTMLILWDVLAGRETGRMDDVQSG